MENPCKELEDKNPTKLLPRVPDKYNLPIGTFVTYKDSDGRLVYARITAGEVRQDAIYYCINNSPLWLSCYAVKRTYTPETLFRRYLDLKFYLWFLQIISFVAGVLVTYFDPVTSTEEIIKFLSMCMCMISIGALNVQFRRKHDL